MLSLPLTLCLLSAADGAAGNFDLFLDARRDVALPVLPERVTALVEAGAVTHLEPRFGVPSIFWAMRLGPAAPAWVGEHLRPAEAARRYVLEYAPLYRLSGRQVAELRASQVHDLGQGALIVTFTRSEGEVPLFRDGLHVVMTRRRELVALTGFLSPWSAKQPGSEAFRLLATTALEVAALDSLALRTGRLHVVSERDEAGWVRLADEARALRVARARRVWFSLPEALEPAWQIELSDGDASFLEVVSARDGRVLSRKNLVETAPAGYRVWADTGAPWAPADSPAGTQPSPHPTGVPLPPLVSPEVASSLITLDFAFARMDPWLPAGATTLRGNNIEAASDLFEPEGFNPPGGLLADGGLLRLRDGGVPRDDVLTMPSSAMTFDWSYDFDAGPSIPSQVQAATTQLFFTTNWVHDWLYGYGFDEAAGNGQRDNLGRGGLAGDPLLAFAMDYSKPNNASMGTFGDGEASVMQMGNSTGLGPWGLTLDFPDGGFAEGLRTNSGPRFYDVTAAVVPMAVDGGYDGCSALLDPASLQGQIALALGAGCTVHSQVTRAQDAGALGVLISRSSTSYGTTTSPEADGSEPPVMALWGPEARDVMALLDGGVPLTARLYSAVVFDRPNALDNTVTVHEFGHFLSNRLISDAAGLSIPISRSLGEGWSDFLALMAMVRESDAQVPSNANWQGAFPMGAWGTAGTDSRGNPLPSAWYGIRRVPYSAALAKDGLTLRHLRDGAALPAGAYPGGLNSEVHNAGEVWASMLWDCFVALLTDRQLVYRDAHAFMLRTLVGSLKATPPNPDYLEAREAVLAVALAEDRPAAEAMYRAFARRGAGPRAVAPSKLSTSNSPVIEDFELGEFVRVTRARVDDSVTWCDADGELDVGETGRLTLTMKNLGTSLSAPINAQVVPLTPGVEIVGDGRAVFPPTLPFATSEASVQVTLTNATTVQQLEFRVDVPGSTATLPALVTAISNLDHVASTTEDFEGEVTLDRGMGWRRGNDLVSGLDEQWQTRGEDDLRTVLWGPSASAPGHNWAITPPLPVGTGPLTVRFKHRWSMEQSNGANWDGAYVEVSEDGQQTWSPVSAPDLVPAYNGVLSVLIPSGDPTTNPEPGRAAFVGTSTGNPSWVNQTINFGTRYAGKTIHLRFVIATDQGTGYAGWDLDDFEASGITTTPFSQRVVDRGACVNRAPTADFPSGGRVDERATATLPSPVDPDGDVLQVTWAQTAGPAAAVTGNTFIAPDVTQDTEVVFEATVSDGSLSVRGQTRFLVVDVNRPPEVTASAQKETWNAGERIDLTALASDPDGDPLEVTWVQTRGPLARQVSANVFEAPPAKEGARLFFEVTVSDGRSEAVAGLDLGLAPAGCGCDAGGGGLTLLLLLGWELRRRRRPQRPG